MNHTSKFLLFLVGSLMWVACHADCYISLTGTDNGNCTLTSPCNTIKHCLDTFTGDVTISLSPGIYNNYTDNCGIKIGGGSYATTTNLVVQGMTSNGTVTIDCQGYASHFRFLSTNTTFTINSVSLINGNSLTNVQANGNGGCLFASAVQSLTVQNVVFQNCMGNSGGAIYTDSPTSIMDSTFTQNFAQCTGLQGGGAVSVNVNNLNSSIFSMSKSVLFNNSAVLYGGAMYIAGDYVSVTDCNITFNSAGSVAGVGGGVYLTSTRPTYVGNYNFLGTTVANNSAVFGGGLYNDNLNHTFNVFGAFFANNTVIVKLTADADPNVYCSQNTSLFCYSCAASDCQTGCAAGNNQSCSLNAAAQAFCYSTKFTTCVGNSCTCSAKSGLPTSAKIVIVLIAVCMLLGIFLIAIDVIRHFRQKKQGYTPIGS